MGGAARKPQIEPGRYAAARQTSIARYQDQPAARTFEVAITVSGDTRDDVRCAVGPS